MVKLSNIVIIGIILIIIVVLGCAAIGLIQIHTKIDSEGITHFKIDWWPSLFPLTFFAFMVWVFSTLWPIRLYRVMILDEIQQAKECVDERYDYCPHCGEKLEYSEPFPWTDEMIQNSIERSNNENQSKILNWFCEDKSGPLVIDK